MKSTSKAAYNPFPTNRLIIIHLAKKRATATSVGVGVGVGAFILLPFSLLLLLGHEFPPVVLARFEFAFVFIKCIISTLFIN